MYATYKYESYITKSSSNKDTNTNNKSLIELQTYLIPNHDMNCYSCYYYLCCGSVFIISLFTTEQIFRDVLIMLIYNIITWFGSFYIRLVSSLSMIFIVMLKYFLKESKIIQMRIGKQIISWFILNLAFFIYFVDFGSLDNFDISKRVLYRLISDNFMATQQLEFDFTFLETIVLYFYKYNYIILLMAIPILFESDCSNDNTHSGYLSSDFHLREYLIE